MNLFYFELDLTRTRM
ncbi:UNVERIFIED_CONTAM: hypothetical protein GTU68_009939 [Idotea baltica]|nr:hypothetical protein [Idotea baltica]